MGNFPSHWPKWAKGYAVLLIVFGSLVLVGLFYGLTNAILDVFQ